MKDIKTTLWGMVAAAAAVVTLHVQQGASLMDWKTWLIPAALAALGFMAKDKN